MKLHHTPKFVQWITGGFARAICLAPLGIFFKYQKDLQNQALLRHETTHWKQQWELLILPFFFWYGLEYLIKRLYYRNHLKAYRAISFEREARASEKSQYQSWLP